MAVLSFLILFPAVVAVLLFVLRNDMARKIIVCVSAVAIGLVSIYFVVANLSSGGQHFEFSSLAVDYVCTAIGVIIAIVILVYGVRYRNTWATLLALIQVTASLIFDFAVAQGLEVENGFYVDTLSLIMAFIIGVVGSGICVYAVGYMQDFQEHEPQGAKDRRPTFFALMFLFLSAMYVIVFCDNMMWMFTGWEITTVCSFLLIGYTKTDEAINNAFRQIIMNLVGGLAFLVALYISALYLETLSFQEFLEIGVDNPTVVAIPVCALVLAGLTKAAQMPFHTWLLGAMVAPTPTSALLHSSTMVKAGVFLLIRLAPVMQNCTSASLMAILAGGFTFLFCSCMAISQSNAKRVLAYSTIANLGLITACAGVGTAEAVWAATFLLLFHAVAKSLLFLCVGTAEHHIGSRDIEDMDLLFERMPRLARFMMLGIMVMFIAPFGMLISKWAALASFVNAGQVALILILAFGSAATFMFWAKWLGKLSSIAAQPDNVELTVHKTEWAALILMVLLTVLACVMLPVLALYVVDIYVYTVFGTLGQSISFMNLIYLSIICIVAIVALFFGPSFKSKKKKASVYLAGASRDNEQRTFRNSMSGTTEATARNLYLEDWFGEDKLRSIGELMSATIIIIAFAVAFSTLPTLF